MIRRWVRMWVLLVGVASVTGSTAFGAITMNAFVADLQALPSFQVRVMTTDALGGSYPTAPQLGTPDYVNGAIQRRNSRGEARIETNISTTTTPNWKEIQFTPSWADSPWVYETFCIERGEGIDLNGTAYYATLDAGAWYGTNADGSYASPDLLSADTKLLFALYADGRLDNILLGNTNNDYTYDSPHDAERLQNLFWYLEDSLSLSSGSTELAWLAVIRAWRTATAQNALDAAAYQAAVKVVNLWTIPITGTPYPEEWRDKHKQSFLIYAPTQPEAPPVVPEPITLVIWSGMGGLGLAFSAYRRRGKCVTK